MSLLNNMLRDLSSLQKTLEKENSGDEVQTSLEQPDQRALLNNSSVIKPLPISFLPSVVVFILVLALLLAWKQNFWLTPSKMATNSPLATISSTAEVNQQRTNTAFTPIEANAETLQSTELKSAAEENIEAELNNAEKTGGTKSSEEALDNRLAALESAISRLSTAVEKSTAMEEANVAMSYVAAETPASMEYQSHTQEEDSELAQSESESIQDPFATAEASMSEPTPDITTAQADTHLSISPNPLSVDKREAEKAKELLAKGQENNAIIALQSFITTAKSPRESTKVLLDVFSAQQNIIAMNEVLEHADYLTAVDKIFYAAKIAVIQQRETDAIQMLEERLSDAGDQENYRALLAGLYQRAEKFDEAAALYRRLLINSGEKPAYWLGFALAQDSLNQTQTARQAYLRLAGYPDLQPQVRSYIEQRLAVLQ